MKPPENSSIEERVSGALWCKTVRNGDTIRKIYYNPKTQTQVAVVVDNRNDRLYRVCIPHEHAGWAFRCSSLDRAERYIQRECSRFGKLKNAIQFTLANKRLAHL